MNKQLRDCLGIVILATLISSTAASQPEVLILGTYHMASPGRDVHNMEVDDVYSAQRQQELDELVTVLARFRPTKIAVEAKVGNKAIASRYADYLNEVYTLSRNEIDQIGFRLAKKLGHDTIYAVDEDGEFPFYRVQNYARANNREKEFATMQAVVAERVSATATYLHSHSILETLVLINSAEQISRAVAEYYTYVPFGEPYEYAGPELIARWFERNIRIYHNIHALISNPNERVLVIYGAGHTGWLQMNVENDATVRLRRLQSILDKPK